MMHSIHFFPPAAPMTQTQTQDWSCFIGWWLFSGYCSHSVYAGLGGLQTTGTPPETVKRRTKSHSHRAELLASLQQHPLVLVFPDSVAWLDLSCKQKVVLCILMTWEPASQQTENNYTHTQRGIHPHTPLEKDLDLCSCISLTTTPHTTKLQRLRKASYQAIIECPHWGRRLYPATTAWPWRCLQTSSLNMEGV